MNKKEPDEAMLAFEHWKRTDSIQFHFPGQAHIAWTGFLAGRRSQQHSKERLADAVNQSIVYMETENPGNSFRLMCLNVAKKAIKPTSNPVIAKDSINTSKSLGATTDKGEGV